ncbi:hypothetical protein [Enterobacter kobei]|uniref:hypothetical protein n=1 Tax=Enterobacter kobei TaxID=208224 RepID=UPI001D02EF2E|nr:hypothetical protein [Enterobacter kobei]
MTFTKERLTELSRRENVGAILGEEIAELARIALASLEAEAVCVIDQSNLDYLKSGSDADVWPASRAEMGDVLLYRSATPAPVSVPDEVTAEDCPAFVKYDVTDVDEAWARGFNAYRAAMLQSFGNSEQLNSPVIPDGWVMVPVEPTAEMLQSGISAHYERSQIQIHDKPAPGPMEYAYVAMLAAAPQQEVTHALAKGMERYGDAMLKLAKKEDSDG